MLGKVLETISRHQQKKIWAIAGQSIINHGLMMCTQN